jgi:hypothetical protein
MSLALDLEDAMDLYQTDCGDHTVGLPSATFYDPHDTMYVMPPARRSDFHSATCAAI